MWRTSVIALLIVGGTAGAHGQTSPLSIDVAIDGDRITVELRTWIDETKELREHFDRDGNGRLDDGERTALASYVIDQSARAFTLDEIALHEADRSFDIPDGATAHVAATIVYRGKLTARTLTIHAETKSKLATPIRLTAHHTITRGEASPKAPFAVQITR